MTALPEIERVDGLVIHNIAPARQAVDRRGPAPGSRTPLRRLDCMSGYKTVFVARSRCLGDVVEHGAQVRFASFQRRFRPRCAARLHPRADRSNAAVCRSSGGLSCENISVTRKHAEGDTNIAVPDHAQLAVAAATSAGEFRANVDGHRPRRVAQDIYKRSSGLRLSSRHAGRCRQEKRNRRDESSRQSPSPVPPSTRVAG